MLVRNDRYFRNFSLHANTYVNTIMGLVCRSCEIMGFFSEIRVPRKKDFKVFKYIGIWGG